MKLNRINLNRDKEGALTLIPEDSDDIWLLYNLIGPGDEVECMTFRKVINESNSGNVDTMKIKLLLAVSVEKTDADLKAPSLRINGKNVKENQHVKLGSYHTLEVEPERSVKVWKRKWDQLDIQLVKQAASPTGKCQVGAVVLQEGLAHLCTVTSGGIKVLQRVEGNMPKKNLGSTSKMDAAVDKFYAAVQTAIKATFNLERLKALVIASPGAFREELYKRIIDNALAASDRAVLDHKAKFMRVTCSSGQPTALEEILKDPKIASLLADTKSAQDSKLMDTFHKLLNDEDSPKAFFGYKQIRKAAVQGAVKDFMLLDTIYR
jgi:protein pelota